VSYSDCLLPFKVFFGVAWETVDLNGVRGLGDGQVTRCSSINFFIRTTSSILIDYGKNMASTIPTIHLKMNGHEAWTYLFFIERQFAKFWTDKG
jgi:hypothetical protein